MKPGLHRHDTAQNLVFGVKAAGYRRKQPKGVDIATALKFLAAIFGRKYGYKNSIISPTGVTVSDHSDN